MLIRPAGVLSGIILLLGACGKDVPLPSPEEVHLIIPAGFPQPELPADNPLSRSKIALGKLLFFDPILSRDSSISCGSCHQPALAFSDSKAFSTGVEHRKGSRNAPPLFNLAWKNLFLLDGGITRLDIVPLNAIVDHNEFDSNINEALKKLNRTPRYREWFRKVFADTASSFTFFKAIEAFELTLVSGNSRYDLYVSQNQPGVLNEQERRGMALFFSERTNCSECHSGFNFTSYGFENNGLYGVYTDTGRQRITMQAADRAKFMVPSLRNVEYTAPYMHDGSLASLDDVVSHYNAGGAMYLTKSPLIRPLQLSEAEKSDLVAFLKSLSDPDFIADPRFRP